MLKFKPDRSKYRGRDDIYHCRLSTTAVNTVAKKSSVKHESHHGQAAPIHLQQRRSSQVRTLKNLCINQVIQLRFLWEARHTQGVKKLSNSLQNDVLEIFLRSDKAINRTKNVESLVFAFLNEDTTKLDLSRWNYFDDSDDLEYFIEELPCGTPSLEEFTCKASSYFDTDLDPPVLKNLLQLKHLTRLSIEGVCCWTNEDLILLSESLKNLVHVKVTLDDQVIPHVGFGFFPALEYLRYLHFRFLVRYEEYDDTEKAHALVYKWCAENMPYLKEIFAGKEDFGDVRLGFPVPANTPYFKGTCQVEFLYSERYLPPAELPNLTHLMFSGPMKNNRTLQRLCKYRKLTHLQINVDSNDRIDAICSSIGRQLKELRIVNFVKGFDIFIIIHHCPNLVNLSWSTQGKLMLVSPYAARVNQRRCFQSLESVTLTNPTEHEYPAGFLKLLIKAPLIRKMFIGKIDIATEDYQLFRDVGPDNLVHLTHFSMEPIINLADREFTPHLGMMVKSIISNSPCLEEIDVKITDCAYLKYLLELPPIVKLLKDCEDFKAMQKELNITDSNYYL